MCFAGLRAALRSLNASPDVKLTSHGTALCCCRIASSRACPTFSTVVKLNPNASHQQSCPLYGSSLATPSSNEAACNAPAATSAGLCSRLRPVLNKLSLTCKGLSRRQLQHHHKEFKRLLEEQKFTAAISSSPNMSSNPSPCQQTMASTHNVARRTRHKAICAKGWLQRSTWQKLSRYLCACCTLISKRSTRRRICSSMISWSLAA